VPDRKHKHRDVYLVLITALFSIFALPWLTLWTVKESTPSAHIDIWPNPLTIAGPLALVLGIYITLALIFNWPLPGGFTGATTFRAPPPKKRRSGLLPGDRLLAGEALYSPDGRTRFRLQPDCQMVVDVQGFGVLCDTGTGNQGTARSLTLQEDGRLVLYDVDGNQVWQQGPRGVRFEVQDDTNVVLYPSKGPAIWSTGTVVKGLG
jgi:hypothetical protein